MAGVSLSLVSVKPQRFLRKLVMVPAPNDPPGVDCAVDDDDGTVADGRIRSKKRSDV